ncbi:MAG: Lpg1974 family pore-forming outer membrane protein, partial [Simkaniaceae bacterium]|nr:Lpg1974 family pore-forming outer membrane protein [Simkaniaceae bacterium]
NGLPTTNEDTCMSEFKKNHKVNPWWIGIRGGVDPTFYFTKNWSMFGKLALSTLWNGTTEKVKDTTDVCDSSGSPSGASTNMIIRQFQGNNHNLTGVLEWQLGLCYDYWWNDDDYHFGIAAAWENQKWDDMFWFQGFTLQFRFDF